MDKIEKDRHRALVAGAQDLQCDVKSLLEIAAPGSFFCHELVVVLAFLTDSLVEQLDSPSLVVNAGWYTRMRGVVDSLCALCYEIETEHIDKAQGE